MLLLATSTNPHATAFPMVRTQLASFLDRFDFARAIVNFYRQPPPSQLALHASVVLVSNVTGFKTKFWKRVLTPARTAAFELVWLVDDDMAVGDPRFNFTRLLELREQTNVSLIAPSPSGPGRGMWNADEGRGRPLLRGCAVRLHATVELKAPLFTEHAWEIVHSVVLQRLPDRTLVGPMIDLYWCGLLEEREMGCDAHLRKDRNASCWPGIGRACAYSYATPLAHLDHKTLEKDFGMGKNATTSREQYNVRVVQAALARAGLRKYFWAQPSWRPRGTALQSPRQGCAARS